MCASPEIHNGGGVSVDAVTVGICRGAPLGGPRCRGQRPATDADTGPGRPWRLTLPSLNDVKALRRGFRALFAVVERRVLCVVIIKRPTSAALPLRHRRRGARERFGVRCFRLPDVVRRLPDTARRLLTVVELQVVQFGNRALVQHLGPDGAPAPGRADVGPRQASVARGGFFVGGPRLPARMPGKKDVVIDDVKLMTRCGQ